MVPDRRRAPEMQALAALAALAGELSCVAAAPVELAKSLDRVPIRQRSALPLLILVAYSQKGALLCPQCSFLLCLLIRRHSQHHTSAWIQCESAATHSFDIAPAFLYHFFLSFASSFLFILHDAAL